jgi:lipopolysaccharide export system permease protein
MFAMLTSIFQIIHSNELVALHSLGISKMQVIRPIFYISLLFTLIYIGLNASSFVKANEFADNIKRHGEISQNTNNLFLKSFDTYIYIQNLNPIAKTGSNLKIFITENGDLKEIINAKRGTYKDNFWNLEDVQIIKKPQITDYKLSNKALKYEHLNSLKALKGFKPQIIDNLYKGDSKLTIQESIQAINLLKSQNLKTNKIRANLYTMILFPLFVPILIIGMFYQLPTLRRGANIAFLSTMSIFGVLVLWGILFTMAKISTNGAINPELGIALPVFLVFLLSIFLVYKNR